MSATHRERIGLVASRTLRTGPDSPLARWVRTFEPYLRDCLQPELYVVEGTYRALLRYGLLRDYPWLYPLPSGLHGGLVSLANRVVPSATPDEEAPLPLDRIIYLMDPRDPTTLFPDALALKRECVVAARPLLANYTAALEWYTLQWFADSQQQRAVRSPHGSDFVEPELLERLLPAAVAGLGAQTIALIAHDSKKRDMLEFAQTHFDFLRQFRARLATGTTGTLLNGQLPERLSAAQRQSLEPLAQALAERLAQPWVTAFPSGPKGGDIRIADIVREGRCQKVLFFEDPHVSREHEADIQLLERTTRIPGNEVLCLNDATSAQQWAAHWKTCIAAGQPGPVTLPEAFQRLWGVDLVLSELGADADDPAGTAAVWQDIVDKAAWYVLALIAERARTLPDGERLRVALGPGLGIYDLVTALAQVREQLLTLDPEQRQLTRRVADSRYCTPGRVQTLPTVGILGALDPRSEANHNAVRLAALLGGAAATLAQFAFYEERRQNEIAVTVGTELPQAWAALDIALFTCDPLHAAGRRALPPVLREPLERMALADVGGIYLHADGSDVVPRQHQRAGLSLAQLRRVAGRAGAVLLAGAQTRRLQPALTALQAGLVSVLVTDRAFATELLRLQASV